MMKLQTTNALDGTLRTYQIQGLSAIYAYLYVRCVYVCMHVCIVCVCMYVCTHARKYVLRVCDCVYNKYSIIYVVYY